MNGELEGARIAEILLVEENEDDLSSPFRRGARDPQDVQAPDQFLYRQATGFRRIPAHDPVAPRLLVHGGDAECESRRKRSIAAFMHRYARHR
jgi:hypothetical protein